MGTISQNWDLDDLRFKKRNLKLILSQISPNFCCLARLMTLIVLYLFLPKSLFMAGSNELSCEQIYRQEQLLCGSHTVD